MKSSITIPTYREALEDLQERLNSLLPPEALEVFSADADSLQQRHTRILQLQAGDTAPDFSLLNATGEPRTLSGLLRGGKVVLVLYRGTWCPYCNLQLNQYNGVLEDMLALGAQLVALSPQTPDESLNMREKNELDFEVLSDPGNIVARKFTTVFRNDDAPVAAMATLGIDFEEHYGDDSHEIPVPAVFIIDQDRRVLFAKTEGGDYRQRVEAREILDVLENEKIS